MSNYYITVRGSSISKFPRTMEIRPKNFVQVRLFKSSLANVINIVSGIRENASVIFTNFASVNITLRIHSGAYVRVYRT